MMRRVNDTALRKKTSRRIEGAVYLVKCTQLYRQGRIEIGR